MTRPGSASPYVSHVLCGLDYSTYSRKVLDYAVAFAALYGARVTALHVASAGAALAAVPAAEGFGAPATGAFDPRAARDELSRFVTGATRRPVECEIAEGAAAARILERADALGADMIVVGTHGRSAFERLLLGSVADKVLRRASQPVLTVPPDAPAVPGFARVLCATDLSPAADRALDRAVSIIGRSQGRLVVLHVLEMPDVPEDIPEAPSYDVEAFWEVYRDRARRLMEAAIPAPVRDRSSVEAVMAPGRAHAAIVERARRDGEDLIVLGTQGRGPIERLFLGSTADQVVRRSPCAVLTVRPV